MKQKELLKGLLGKGITLNTRALAQFSAENGILVNVRCGRLRGRVGLPPKLLGLRPDKWAEDSKQFFGDHVAMGQLTMVPKELDAKLNQLDTRVRRLVQNYSVNGSYMPLSEYDEFKAEYKVIRADYLKTIKEVVAQWDTIRDDFIVGLKALVETVGAKKVLKRDREQLVRQIINSIPTASQYQAGAYMEMEVRAFPTTGVTVEGLAPDLQDTLNSTWRNDVVSNACKCIEQGIGQIFVQTCKTAEVYARTGKMDGRSVNVLIREAAKARKMNVFANPLLETLANRLSALEGLTDERLAEETENAILDTIVYARATGINLDMKECPFSEKQIETMLALREKYRELKEKHEEEEEKA